MLSAWAVNLFTLICTSFYCLEETHSQLTGNGCLAERDSVHPPQITPLSLSSLTRAEKRKTCNESQINMDVLINDVVMDRNELF